jgi:hypothetical protein
MGERIWIMKDPLGHGSNGRGAFKAPKHQFKVERHIAFHGETAAGQKVTTTGNIWEKVASGKRRAVAEKIAMGARIDNPNARVRIK